MSLFKPNIKKLTEKKDIIGLLKELKNKNLKTRIEVVDALISLKSVQGLFWATKSIYDLEVRIKAISALADFPDAFKYLANILTNDENEYIMEKAFESLNKLNIKDDEIWLNLATKLLKIKRYKYALKIFEKGAKLNPSPDTYGGIGMALIENNLYEEGLKYFDKAVELDPTKKICNNIGSILFENKKYEDALKYFDKYLEIDPDNASVWEKKGAVHFQLNQTDKAIECLNKAIQIDPNLEIAIDLLYIIYLKKKDFNTLESLLHKLLQLAPDNIKFHIKLAEVFALSNQLLKAESKLKKTLELLYQKEYLNSEELCAVHRQLGIVYVMRGHKEKAINEFKKAIQADQQDQWTYKLLDAYLTLDKLGIALKESPITRMANLIKLAEKIPTTYSSLEDWEKHWN